MSAEVLDHLEWMIIRKEGPCGDRLATISKKTNCASHIAYPTWCGRPYLRTSAPYGAKTETHGSLREE
jgi:hypothetical protein